MKRVDVGVEPFRIGEAADHEAREHLVGVEDEKGTVAACVLDVNEAGRSELSEQAVHSAAAEAMIMAGSPATRPSARKAEALENSPSSRGVELHGMIRAACGSDAPSVLKDSTCRAGVA